MADLTDDQILFIRDFIGNADIPTDDDLNEMWLRLGSEIKVAYNVLQNRLANYLSEAASYSIVGVYQESSQANIDNLRQQLKDLAAEFPEVISSTPTDTGGGIGFAVTRIVRVGKAR